MSPSAFPDRLHERTVFGKSKLEMNIQQRISKHLGKGTQRKMYQTQLIEERMKEGTKLIEQPV